MEEEIKLEDITSGTSNALINEIKYNELMQQRVEILLKKNKEQEQELEHYKQIGIMHYKRPYAKRYIEEKKKDNPSLMYPDSEEIYKDYYELREQRDKAIECIEDKLKVIGLGGYTDLVDILEILRGDKEWNY